MAQVYKEQKVNYARYQILDIERVKVFCKHCGIEGVASDAPSKKE